jgi:hypothetical protein
MTREAHTRSMFTLAFLHSQQQMRRHLIGARVDDPVLPSAGPAEERGRKPVDRARPSQRRAHVAFVTPQPSGGDKHLC